jgi:hypothetical protein
MVKWFYKLFKIKRPLKWLHNGDESNCNYELIILTERAMYRVDNPTKELYKKVQHIAIDEGEYIDDNGIKVKPISVMKIAKV